MAAIQAERQVGEEGDGPGHPRQGYPKNEIKKITFML